MTDISDRGYVPEGEKDVRGTKSRKERVTVLATVNMEGEKLPLLVIGKSAKPRCLKNILRTPDKLPVMYRSSKNAWMTEKIFTDWLREWDRKLVEEGREVCLLLDNASVHKDVDLDNITLVFFPPNTTSILQPLDAGILANFKYRYR